jgi:hypothetical protein
MKTISLDKSNIQSKLTKGPFLVTFTKKDGTLRDMKCTLAEQFLPQHIKTETVSKVVAENDNLIKAFDLEKQAWRSFNVDSVISIFETNE